MFIFLGKGKAETYERHCSRSLLITTEVSEETDERKSFIKLKLTSFALPTVEQVRDRHSEPLGLFFAGKIQTDLTGLEMKRERSHWYHWHFWKASDEFTRVKNVTEVTLWLICKHQWNVCVKMKVFPTGTVTNLGEIIGNKEFWRQQEPLKRNVVQMRTRPQGKKLCLTNTFLCSLLLVKKQQPLNPGHLGHCVFFIPVWRGVGKPTVHDYVHLLQMKWSRIWSSSCWSCGKVPAQTWLSPPVKKKMETETKHQSVLWLDEGISALKHSCHVHSLWCQTLWRSRISVGCLSPDRPLHSTSSPTRSSDQSRTPGPLLNTGSAQTQDRKKEKYVISIGKYSNLQHQYQTWKSCIDPGLKLRVVQLIIYRTETTVEQALLYEVMAEIYLMIISQLLLITAEHLRRVTIRSADKSQTQLGFIIMKKRRPEWPTVINLTFIF